MKFKFIAVLLMLVSPLALANTSQCPNPSPQGPKGTCTTFNAGTRSGVSCYSCCTATNGARWQGKNGQAACMNTPP